MKCGIIFWGNSVDRKKRFSVNKKIVRIIIGLTGLLVNVYLEHC